ncbi:Hypothetical protein NTJ_02595 [Nesidiocoris tenuis]|uniref:Uncharacterized protein n=1 Tax=Nesidiocoris tenuis TaxID=355587 RepID=A0ABN7ABV7_9HEMI|nr:Hypothetical protein NTJ_02595 [Nesidiocoris tenuis]
MAHPGAGSDTTRTPTAVYRQIIGIPPPFDGTEPWSSYTQRLGQYFFTNDIPDGKKGSVWITSITSPVFEVLRELCHPALSVQ